MPKQGSAGFSKHTRVKALTFETIMRAHVAIVAAMTRRMNGSAPPYYYYDLTAGPGVVNGIDGSPVIAKRLLKGMRHLIALFEKDKASARELEKRFAGDSSVWVQNDDFANLRVHLEPHIKQNFSLGLMYWDGNGTIPPKEEISDIFAGKKFEGIDLLLHVCAGTMKLCKTVAENAQARGGDTPKCLLNQPNMSTIDLCESIPKKKWLVSPPQTCRHWTFLLGTNYERYSDYKKIGMMDWHSFHGSRNLLRTASTIGVWKTHEHLVIERSGKFCEDRQVCGGELVPAQDGAMGWCLKTHNYYWSCRKCQNGKNRRYRPSR